MNPQAAAKRFDGIASNYVTSEVHRASASMAYVKERFADRSDLRLLDLACGAGHFGFTLSPHASHVTFCDPSPSMLVAVADRAGSLGLEIATVDGSAEDLPFEDSSFDLVLSRLAPHHFSDPAKAVAEIARVLAPGGHCAIVDLEGAFYPTADALNHSLEVLHDPTHGRSYTQIEWCRFLRAAGLSIEEVQGGLSESETGVTIERWCQIAETDDGARREIESMLAKATARELAALGIWHDTSGFRMPIRTALYVAFKP
ncbi:class I SAM-dependent methyltransferase [Mesorhizobium sp. L2C084A000]|uniref:class I SAM-dependent methyltransferase n=1 Tax=Mesorhizobium sp. L2C084A000 TaxID=1287116 RepID=UPI0003D034A0|nr:class I SAM-dependent methyltransferase [Mesorhizobium sp. L2C084A000]ESZ22843.1 hypothetical protein X734_28770 [Mesorhizobium sp. L2C084A000]